MTDSLQLRCWLEGEIYGGRIKKGQRLISDRATIIGVFNRDLTEEETKAGIAGSGLVNADYITFSE